MSLENQNATTNSMKRKSSQLSLSFDSSSLIDTAQMLLSMHNQQQTQSKKKSRKIVDLEHVENQSENNSQLAYQQVLNNSDSQFSQSQSQSITKDLLVQKSKNFEQNQNQNQIQTKPSLIVVDEKILNQNAIHNINQDSSDDSFCYSYHPNKQEIFIQNSPFELIKPIFPMPFDDDDEEGVEERSSQKNLRLAAIGKRTTTNEKAIADNLIPASLRIEQSQPQFILEYDDQEKEEEEVGENEENLKSQSLQLSSPLIVPETPQKQQPQQQLQTMSSNPSIVCSTQSIVCSTLSNQNQHLSIQNHSSIPLIETVPSQFFVAVSASASFPPNLSNYQDNLPSNLSSRNANLMNDEQRIEQTFNMFVSLLPEHLKEKPRTIYSPPSIESSVSPKKPQTQQPQQTPPEPIIELNQIPKQQQQQQMSYTEKVPSLIPLASDSKLSALKQPGGSSRPNSPQHEQQHEKQKEMNGNDSFKTEESEISQQNFAPLLVCSDLKPLNREVLADPKINSIQNHSANNTNNVHKQKLEEDENENFSLLTDEDLREYVSLELFPLSCSCSVPSDLEADKASHPPTSNNNNNTNNNANLSNHNNSNHSSEEQNQNDSQIKKKNYFSTTTSSDGGIGVGKEFQWPMKWKILPNSPNKLTPSPRKPETKHVGDGGEIQYTLTEFGEYPDEVKINYFETQSQEGLDISPFYDQPYINNNQNNQQEIADKSDQQIENEKLYACFKSSNTVENNKNRHITDILYKLELAHKSQKGEKWNAFACRKAIAALKRHPTQIKNGNEAKKLVGIGERLGAKIQEIIETGTLNFLEENDSIQTTSIFCKIWGVGPETAKRLYSAGFRTIEDLRKNHFEGAVQHLTDVQMIGLKYLDDFQQRIPHDEVTLHGKVVEHVARKIDPDLNVTLCGSYRRGRPTSGDIDVLVWHSKGVKNPGGYLPRIISALKKLKYLTDDLDLQALEREKDWTHHFDKYMGVCRLPSESQYHRRIDILVCPTQNVAGTVLYLTGSEYFNRSMRLYAQRNGYFLCNHCLSRADKNGKRIPNTEIEAVNEEDIFRILNVPYRAPSERDL